jgi:hypothetical protein
MSNDETSHLSLQGANESVSGRRTDVAVHHRFTFHVPKAEFVLQCGTRYPAIPLLLQRFLDQAEGPVRVPN